jgi:hypothetical protein
MAFVSMGKIKGGGKQYASGEIVPDEIVMAWKPQVRQLHLREGRLMVMEKGSAEALAVARVAKENAAKLKRAKAEIPRLSVAVTEIKGALVVAKLKVKDLQDKYQSLVDEMARKQDMIDIAEGADRSAEIVADAIEKNAKPVEDATPPQAASEDEDQDLESMTVVQLRDLARERKMVPGLKNKGELIEMLSEAD